LGGERSREPVATSSFVIPDSLDLRVPPRVAAAVAKAAVDTGLAQLPLDHREVEARCCDLVYEGTIAP
jgi:malate dehydrogenase (oxaloacetate-decarboxylating)